MRTSFENIFRKPDYDDVLKAVQRVKDIHALDRDGNTLLGTAAYYGHLDACRWLVHQGCRIEHTGRDNKTPLSTALWALGGMGTVHTRFLETLAFLLKEGAKVTCRDEEGRTPLHFALRSTRRFPHLTAELLDRGADPNARSTWGETPLMVAAGHGDLEATRLLLAHGAELDARNGSGCTALYCAVSRPTTDDERLEARAVVAELLKAGATLQVIDSRTKRSLLMAAANAGDELLVRRCLAAGHAVDDRDTNGMTALLCACAGSHLAIVDLLLAAGADVQAIDAKKRGAMSFSHDEQVQQRLVKAGLVAPPSKDAFEVDARGVSRLMRACQTKDVERVRRFLEAGDDRNIQDKQGKTALLHLLEPTYHDTTTREVFHLLAERPGLDVRLATKTGLTALHCAVRVSGPSTDIIVRLLELGADPHAKTKTGKTAIAVVKEYNDALRELLKNRKA